MRRSERARTAAAICIFLLLGARVCFGGEPARKAGGYFTAQPAPNQKDGTFLLHWGDIAAHPPLIRAVMEWLAPSLLPRFLVKIATQADGAFRPCDQVADDEKAREVLLKSVEASLPYRLRPPKGFHTYVERRRAITPYWLGIEEGFSVSDEVFWSVKQCGAVLGNVRVQIAALDDAVKELKRYVAASGQYSAELQRRIKDAETAEAATIKAAKAKLQGGEQMDVPALYVACLERSGEQGAAPEWGPWAVALAPIKDLYGTIERIKRTREGMRESVINLAQGALNGLVQFDVQINALEAMAAAMFKVHGDAGLAKVLAPAEADRLCAAWEEGVAAIRRKSRSARTAADHYALDRTDFLCFAAHQVRIVEEIRRHLSAAEQESVANIVTSCLEAKLGAADFKRFAPPAEQPPAQKPLELLTPLYAKVEGVNKDRDVRLVAGELGPLNAAADKAVAAYRATVKARVAALFHSRLADKAVAPPGEEALMLQLSRLKFLARPINSRLDQIRLDFDRRTYYFRLEVLSADVQAPLATFDAHATGGSNLFNTAATFNFMFGVFFTSSLLLMVWLAKRRSDLYIRKIAGLDAVDEAIGRATEMGQPALFVHGLTGVGDVAVLASLNILGRVAKQVATYDSRVLVANNDPIVYSISQEVVREGFTAAGRPDLYNRDDIFMCASDQFPFTAAVAGIMARERPAANFFMGYFYAEALILAEAGSQSGAIQICGTDAFTQLPFFITTCDYTLIGEELYAASAYLSREPRLLGTLKAQDWGKAAVGGLILLGVVLHFVLPHWNIVELLLKLYD